MGLDDALNHGQTLFSLDRDIFFASVFFVILWMGSNHPGTLIMIVRETPNSSDKSDVYTSWSRGTKREVENSDLPMATDNDITITTTTN